MCSQDDVIASSSSFRSIFAQRHEFSPSVVAMALRMLITVWMIIFHVSLFFIILKRPPLPPLGHLTSVAQGTALPSLRHRLTFSQSSEGLVRPLWGELTLREEEDFVKGLKPPSKSPPIWGDFFGGCGFKFCLLLRFNF